MIYGRISFRQYQIGALKHEVSITANAIIGRDLNGLTSARFAIISIPTFDARIATASVPKIFVHPDIKKWYKGICVSESGHNWNCFHQSLIESAWVSVQVPNSSIQREPSETAPMTTTIEEKN